MNKFKFEKFSDVTLNDAIKVLDEKAKACKKADAISFWGGLSTLFKTKVKDAHEELIKGTLKSINEFIDSNKDEAAEAITNESRMMIWMLNSTIELIRGFGKDENSDQEQEYINSLILQGVGFDVTLTLMELATSILDGKEYDPYSYVKVCVEDDEVKEVK